MLALLVSVLAACGRKDGPRFGLLARGFEPSSPLQAQELAPVAGGGQRVHLEPAPDGQGYWVRSTIPAEAWRSGGLDGVWAAPRAFPGEDPATSGREPTLEGDEGRYEYAVKLPVSVDDVTQEPGIFRLLGGRLFVARPPGAPAPGTLVLREYLSRGESDAFGRRVVLGALDASGIPLLTGGSEEVVTDLPPASALSFWTSALADAWLHDAPPAHVVFRVELDGETLFEEGMEVANGPATAYHVVALPPGGRRGAHLVFSLAGDPARGAFHAPCVRPRAVGSPGHRPWGASRPDIVLLDLDTFRADNLAAYGGDPALTPNLNALASDSLVLGEARATAPWTLPSHATIFSGLLPYQAACIRNESRLDDDAVTLAEVLQRAGYRTVAITDGGFVSRAFGFEQGFEWFQEKDLWDPADFEVTLAHVRAQLDADDGRPLFLLVHSYRAHDPYVVSDETRAELGDALHVQGTFDPLRADCQRAYVGTLPAADLARYCERARPLYRGGVHDLDRGVGELLELLRGRGYLDEGGLVLLSDHGESFGEHGHAGHGSQVFDEQLRVPFVVHGAGVAARREDGPVSLLDVAPTVAALAGLAPDRRWMGANLLAAPPPADRTLFAFVGRQPEEEIAEGMAAIREHHKVVLASVQRPAEGWSAYDLRADPGETQDRVDAPWARALVGEVQAGLDSLLEPLLHEGRAEIPDAVRQQLDRLGYAQGR